MSILEIVVAAYAMFAPPADLLVSEWSNGFRRLSPEASAEPGEFDINRTPYMREFVDCYNDPEVEEVIMQKSSQVAYTENLNNILAYIADRRPGPVMLMQPTLEMAEAYSKERITPMVRDTPCLTKLIDDRSRKGGNTILNKKFPGGYWQFVGANSPASLASRPVRDLFVDEWDRAPSSAGDEGSPDKIAEARQITFFDRKRYKGGTPTLKGQSRTVRGFLSGDQRHYHVPCPRCGDHIPLNRDRLQMVPDAEHYAEYQCQSCEGWIQEHERFDMIRDKLAGGTARWVPHAAGPSWRRSYFIWAIYSPWKSWRSMCDAWNEAKGDPEEEQVITNTLFGEAYAFVTGDLDHEHLWRGREDYDGQRLPDDVEIITAGIDTQDNRFEVEIVGWGAGEESWSIEYFTIEGDPATASVREQLDAFLSDSVYTRADGRAMGISAAFIDSGGHRTDAVYQFARGKQRRHIFASKGSSVAGQPIFVRFSEQKKERIRLAVVGTDTAKEVVYSRLAKGAETKAPCHFPLSYSVNYFKGLVAEEKIVTWKSGTPLVTWKKRKDADARNEPLDCRVYALAALRSLPMALRRLRRKEAVKAKAEKEAAVAPAAELVETLKVAVAATKEGTKQAIETRREKEPKPPRRQAGKHPFRRSGGWSI